MRASKVVTTLAIFAMGLALGVIALRHSPPIRIVASGTGEMPLYALIYSGSGPRFEANRIDGEGYIHAPKAVLTRGNTWALCVTDGSNILWDGNLILKRFGCIELPIHRISTDTNKLSANLSEVLHSSSAWEKFAEQGVAPQLDASSES